MFGNVILGPTAEDLDDKDDTASSAAGLARLRAEGKRIMPALLEHEVTAVYAGLRARPSTPTTSSRWIPRRLRLRGGIRSTGLSASMASIAEHIRDGRGPWPSHELPRAAHARTSASAAAPYAQAERDRGRPRVRADRLLLRERASRAARSATRSRPISPADADGLRRRTRALMGRCQGFFCGAEVAALLDEAAR